MWLVRSTDYWILAKPLRLIILNYSRRTSRCTIPDIQEAFAHVPFERIPLRFMSEEEKARCFLFGGSG